MSQKEQLSELVAARVDAREKRLAARDAKSAYEAARKRFEELFDQVEMKQGTLPFHTDAKPKKPYGPGDEAAAKSDVG